MTPSEFYKTKVIGKVYSQMTMVIDGKTVIHPVEDHEVIATFEMNGTMIYVCNQWHKQGIPQLIPQVFVIKYETYKEKFLFLDCDGVINSDNYALIYKSPYYLPDLENIDPVAISHLNQVMEHKPETKIIISSSWKNRFSIEQIRASFTAKGFLYADNIKDKTPTLTNQHRDLEILEFLKDKKDFSFVVIDDGLGLERVSENLIQTNMENGLIEEHIAPILKLLD